MRSKPLILLLFGVLILFVGIAFTSKHPILRRSTSPLPTIAPSHPAFIDQIYERLVYYQQTHWYELILPDMSSATLTGTDKPNPPAFPKIQATWSDDGTLLALATDTQMIAVTDYKTGTLKALLHFPFTLSSSALFSISPDMSMFSAWDMSQAKLLFFTLSDGNLVGSFDTCRSGFWLMDQTYMSQCGDSISAFLLNGTVMAKTNLLTSSPATSYTLINEYGQNTVLVEKKSGQQTSAFSLSSLGKITPLPAALFKQFPIESFADPQKTLARRIGAHENISGIDQVSVSSNNQWVLYHSKDGIWITDLALHQKPYLLIPGADLALFRP